MTKTNRRVFTRIEIMVVMFTAGMFFCGALVSLLMLFENAYDGTALYVFGRVVLPSLASMASSWRVNKELSHYNLELQ